MIQFGDFLNRNQYQETRRLITRKALRSLLRTFEARRQSTRDLPRDKIKRILICRPNHRLGNLVLLTPLIIDAQRLFPGAEIDIVLAGDHGAELFSSLRNVKHIYALHRRMVRHPVAIIRTIMQIRRAHYDLAMDPCETSQSARFLVAMSKASYAIEPPRNEARSNASLPVAARPAPKHMAQWSVFLLRSALPQQTTGLDAEYPALDIHLSSVERLQGRQALKSLALGEGDAHAKAIVGVFADATGAKRHDEAWWMRFIGELLRHHPDYAVVEIAPPDGRSRLASRFPSFSSPSPREVAAVISNMTCFVSADCGVMHLANASGVPTIGLFSASDASKYGPYGNHSQAIDSNGKSPEEVAQLAISIVEQVSLRENSSRQSDHA